MRRFAYGRGVHEGYLTHTQDAHLRARLGGEDDLLEAVGDTEEEGAFNLIDLDALRQVEGFLTTCELAVILGAVYVELVAGDDEYAWTR